MLKWVAVVLAVGVFGCSNSNNPGDMGMGDMGLPDLSIVDPPDLAVPMVLNGTRLIQGRFSILGVTTDDFVIIQDDMTGAIKAQPIAGGAAQTVIASAADGAIVAGKVVFAYAGLNASSVGPVTVWTAAAGAVVVGNTSHPSGLASSTDGMFIMYNDGAALDASTTNVFVSKSDGTAKVQLTGVSQRVTSTACRLRARFGGSTFFISSCASAGDAGVSPATIHAVTTGGVVTELLTGAQSFFTIDKLGTKALGIVDPGANATVVPAAGGPGVLIDTGVTDAEITGDGVTVVYAKGGALMAAPAATGTPKATRAGSGCRILDAISPNDQFVACHDVASMTGKDLLLVGVTAGSPVIVSATPDIATFGDLWTTDSSHFLYYSDLDADEAGTIKAQPAAGGAPVELTTNKGWLSYGAAGSTVLFNDNWRTVSMLGRADIKSVPASGGTPSLIATQADDQPFLSTDKTKAIFTYRAAAGKEGLYAATIP